MAQSPEHERPSATRVPALDGVRGLAIVAVMLHHFWGMPFERTRQPSVRTIDEALLKLMQPGWAGVELFFVLSGFLITGILLDSKGGVGYLRTFYIRRVLRIFPVYYLFLLALIFAVPHFDSLASAPGGEALWDDQWWFWAYLVTIAMSFPASDITITLDTVHLWSLSFEEQFYLAWPAIVLLLSRNQLAVVCAAIVVLSLPLRYALGVDPLADHVSPGAPRFLVPAHAETLALGALVAMAMRDEGWLAQLRRWSAPAAGVGGVTVCGLFLWRDGLQPTDAWIYTIGFLALSVFFAGVVSIAARASPATVAARGLSLVPLRSLGKCSYCMYLVHIFIGFELTKWASDQDLIRTVGGHQFPVNAAFTMAAGLVTYVVAWVSWQLVESRFLALKDRIPYGPGAARPPRIGDVRVVDG